MLKILLVIFLLPCFTLQGFSQKSGSTKRAPQLGDSVYDSTMDDPGFNVCNEAITSQYYHFVQGIQYTGEKTALLHHFEKGLKNLQFPDQTGFINIRFIVNCDGKTGRFRMTEVSREFGPMKFGGGLPELLVKLAKQTDGWRPALYKEHAYDYYQNLTFKIEKGKLIGILP